jgi:glycogen debranching enzyme
MSEPFTAPAGPADAPHGLHSVHAGRDSLDDGVRILKHGETFAVFDRHGDAYPGRSSHGLYHDGTRHLSQLILEIGGARPLLLKSTVSVDNLLLAIDLTNPDLCRAYGCEADTVHIFRGKVVHDGVCHERLRITNHGLEPISFPVTFRFGADFVDLFEVRGAERPRRGRRQSPVVRADEVLLAYRGLDGVVRRTIVTATPAPARVTAGEVRFEIALGSKEQTHIDLRITCQGESPPPRREPRLDFEAARDRLREERAVRQQRVPRIRSSHDLFDRWIQRSLSDLDMMVTETEHGPFPYAGIPWYSTVFGRDGILTALSALWIDPNIARGVLRVLAATQAHDRDDARDAEPGKIVHEMRRGEMAALGEIPFGRYYGTVDATPLFVVLAGAYHARTGDRATIAELWPSLQRALAWIDARSAAHPRGFLSYQRSAPDGLAQQGWKDSDTAIFHDDGRLAPGPIALCEVQGYVYAARSAAAELARVVGEGAAAARLDDAAERLRVAFEDAFWLDDLDTYALAVCGDGSPCRVRTSNAGQVLWSGIAAPARARRVAALLRGDTMFSGWGVRTVATSERRYNPMSYHNGSVWPHDNALIAAGLARYGLKAEALTILTALFDASIYMDLHRIPELICGFARKADQGPTLYPVACSPQAWSAAAPLLMLEACLGLGLDAASRQLRIAGPRLPAWLDWLELHDLAVGSGAVDLRLRRDAEGVTVEMLGQRGDLAVVPLP